LVAFLERGLVGSHQDGIDMAAGDTTLFMASLPLLLAGLFLMFDTFAAFGVPLAYVATLAWRFRLPQEHG
jgi:Na+-translocating ferredoxin:NAD+ oxidoreductase RnfD subunit